MNTHFLLLTALLLFTAPAASAQGGDPVAVASAVDSARYPAANAVPLTAVDRAPSLTGTQPDVRQWVMERVHYPELAVENAIEGRVIIAYVVNPDGAISDVRIHQKLGFGCDEAALVAFRDLPRWTPGVSNGRTVAVQCYTPIDFRLQ